VEYSSPFLSFSLFIPSLAYPPCSRSFFLLNRVTKLRFFPPSGGRLNRPPSSYILSDGLNAGAVVFFLPPFEGRGFSVVTPPFFFWYLSCLFQTPPTFTEPRPRSPFFPANALYHSTTSSPPTIANPPGLKSWLLAFPTVSASRFSLAVRPRRLN